MTDTEATATTAEKTPAQKAQRHAVRVIARALSKLEEGTPDEVKARWADNKDKYTSEARKVARALNKDGITFQLDEENTMQAKRAGKRGKKDAASAND